MDYRTTNSHVMQTSACGNYRRELRKAANDVGPNKLWPALTREGGRRREEAHQTTGIRRITDEGRGWGRIMNGTCPFLYIYLPVYLHGVPTRCTYTYKFNVAFGKREQGQKT